MGDEGYGFAASARELSKELGRWQARARGVPDQETIRQVVGDELASSFDTDAIDAALKRAAADGTWDRYGYERRAAQESDKARHKLDRVLRRATIAVRNWFFVNATHSQRIALAEFVRGTIYRTGFDPLDVVRQNISAASRQLVAMLDDIPREYHRSLVEHAELDWEPVSDA